MDMKRIISVVICLVIGLALLPLILDVIAGVTVTGMAATVIDMIPVFYVLFLLGIAALALKGSWGTK